MSGDPQDQAGGPIDPAAAAKYPGRFPELKLYSVPVELGGWEKAQKVHFADGGTFDQIYGQ